MKTSIDTQILLTTDFCFLFQRYPDSWYKDITSSNKFFSLAAVYRVQIIGLVVAEIKAQSKCNKEVSCLTLFKDYVH